MVPWIASGLFLRNNNNNDDSCVSGWRRAICDCLTGTCGSCIDPNIFFWTAAFTTNDVAPKLVTLTIHFSKGPSGS